MGRVYLEHPGGTVTYHCESCCTYLTDKSKLKSTAFQGLSGPAYLFEDVCNVNLSSMDKRSMLTGEHVVRDVTCKNCDRKLGWMYEFAYNNTQEYKEGHYILERKLMVENNSSTTGFTRSRCASSSSVDSSNVSSSSRRNDYTSKDEKTTFERRTQGSIGKTPNASVGPVHHLKHAPSVTSPVHAGCANVGSLPKSFGGAKKGAKKIPGPDLSNVHQSTGHCKTVQRVRVAERPAEREHDAEAPNSDDEYGTGFKDDELETAFVNRMKEVRGFLVKEVKGDGACMFRAVGEQAVSFGTLHLADQIYGDEEMHHEVRRLCMDYVAKNRDHFSQFITEDFNDYLTRKRLDNVHGNHVELQAMSEIFLRPIEVFEYSTDPINTFHPISREANTGASNPPIRLSYHGSVHYNSGKLQSFVTKRSVVDPYTPSIGVGLGLPEYQPGLADSNLLREATQASERQHIEDAMLKDKMRMTDWERTEDELSRQIANESYLDYLKQLEKKAEDRKKGRSPPSSTPHQLKGRGRSAKQKSPPPPEGKTTHKQVAVKRGASSPNLPSSSRDEEHSNKFAKIHKHQHTSASMPNIGADFGQSLATTNTSLIKPSTSTRDMETPSTSSFVPASRADNLTDRANIAYGDWNSPVLDEALLAQVLAASEREFLESLEKKKKSHPSS